MTAFAYSYSPALDDQLAKIQDERQCYVQRLTELLGRSDRIAEIKGYLRMIENLNSAAIRLARSSAPQVVVAG